MQPDAQPDQNDDAIGIKLSMVLQIIDKKFIPILKDNLENVDCVLTIKYTVIFCPKNDIENIRTHLYCKILDCENNTKYSSENSIQNIIDNALKIFSSNFDIHLCELFQSNEYDADPFWYEKAFLDISIQ